MKTPTKRTYDDFDQAYAYFNKRLFEGRLPPCLITVRPHRGAYGYFSPERFGSRDGKEIHDEIALNIRTFANRTACQILSTLVHEMVHLEQAHFGSPSRGNYHNREWADLMERIGLMPSSTGAPGGKRTGQSMTHYVIEDGPFDRAFAARTFVIPYFDRAGESETTRKKRKVTYTCPVCEDKVWGKPEVQPHCGKCELVPMIASYDTNQVAEALHGESDGRIRKAVPVRDFVRQLLTEGPVPAVIVTAQGRARGFSLSQLHRARRTLGGVAFKQRGGDLNSPWFWALDQAAPEKPLNV